MKHLLSLLILILFSGSAQAEFLSVDRHDGYLSSVEEERFERILEMGYVPIPKPNKKPLKDRIFNNQLRTEFTNRYEQTFGYTAVNRNIDSPGRFSTQQYSPREQVTVEEDIRRKRLFGEYMLRRLTEYHVDDYFKSHENTRAIYEFKERVSHAKISVKKGYELKLHYSLAGNAFEVSMKNPYDIYNRLVVRLGGQSFGPTGVKENVFYNCGYNFTKTWRGEAHIEMESGAVHLIASKQLPKSVTMKISGRTYYHKKNSPPDHRGLLSFSWSN